MICCKDIELQVTESQPTFVLRVAQQTRGNGVAVCVELKAVKETHAREVLVASTRLSHISCPIVKPVSSESPSSAFQATDIVLSLSKKKVMRGNKREKHQSCIYGREDFRGRLKVSYIGALGVAGQPATVTGEFPALMRPRVNPLFHYDELEAS